MLRPNKHSHPDRTVINVSLLILSRLREQRIDEYPILRELAKQYVEGGEILFLPALSFLYLLGLVEYRQKNDTFEYIGVK